MAKSIEDIKQKYWNGESSLKEEAKLKEHYQNKQKGNYEEVFFSYISEKKRSVCYEGEFQFAKQVPRKVVWFKMSIAATFLLLASFGSYFLLKNTPSESTRFEITDEQQAYEITKQTLLGLGSELNKATLAMNNLNQIEKTKNKIIKN